MLYIKLFIIMKQESLNQNSTNLTLAERCAAVQQEFYVGYYVFSSGIISPDKNADSVRSGIIVWKNPDEKAPVGKRALMVTLDREMKAWSDAHVELGGTDDVDGRQNTLEILRRAVEKNIKVPAAEYCHGYNQNGVLAGEGFLPAKEQLMRMAGNYERIHQALVNVGEKGLYGIYISSTEYNKDRAWQVRMEKRQTHVYAKSYPGDYVRCFVAL